MPSIFLPLLIAAIVFIFLIWVDTIPKVGRYLKYFFLFLLFLGAAVVLQLSDFQRLFYPIMLTFTFITVPILAVDTNAEKTSFFGNAFKGLGFQIFTLIFGVFILVVMFVMQGSNTASILNFPLAITSTSDLNQFLAPTLSGSVGFIENAFFISFLQVMVLTLAKFSGLFEAFWAFLGSISGGVLSIGSVIQNVLNPIIPVIVVAVSFGTLHVVAYQFSLASMIWAGMIFTIFTISYYLSNKDTTPMDVAHYGWNAIHTAGRALSIGF